MSLGSGLWKEDDDRRDVWDSFTHDPRDPRQLRCAPRRRPRRHPRGPRRGVRRRPAGPRRVRRAQRAVSAARTLGELPPLVADLVPASTARRRPVACAGARPPQIQGRRRGVLARETAATRSWASSVRLICWSSVWRRRALADARTSRGRDRDGRHLPQRRQDGDGPRRSSRTRSRAREEAGQASSRSDAGSGERVRRLLRRRCWSHPSAYCWSASCSRSSPTRSSTAPRPGAPCSAWCRWRWC